jgi:hypothetical protein
MPGGTFVGTSGSMSLQVYPYRSARTRQIDSRLQEMCDTGHANRLEGHSLHAIVSQQRHYILAPAMSHGEVLPKGEALPCYYVCIWSVQPGQNMLWNLQADRDVTCHLFNCYFPTQFTGMQFIMAGTFGSAYRAVWNRSDGKPPLNVVIKRIDLERIGSSEFVLVLREKMLLQRLHDEHISSIILQYNDPLNSAIVYFVLEDGGPSTLDNMLRDAIHTQAPIMPSNVRIIMDHVSSLHLCERVSVAHFLPRALSM